MLMRLSSNLLSNFINPAVSIPYQIAITPTSASILFNLEFNGVSYGSVQDKY
jgi:hypothetical protein